MENIKLQTAIDKAKALNKDTISDFEFFQIWNNNIYGDINMTKFKQILQQHGINVADRQFTEIKKEIKLPITIQIPFTINDEWVNNVVCTGFDSSYGGCWYWIDTFAIKDNDKKGCKYATEIISKGGVYLITVEEEKDKIYKFDLKTLTKGFKKYIKWAIEKGKDIYYDPADIDVEIADIIIQFGIFGEIIYE
jgi:hypothetical protein